MTARLLFDPPDLNSALLQVRLPLVPEEGKEIVVVEASSSALPDGHAVELDLAAALEEDDGGRGSNGCSPPPHRTITLLEAPLYESAARWIATAAAATAPTISIADEVFIQCSHCHSRHNQTDLSSLDLATSTTL